MNTATGALSALRRLGIVIAIAIVFLFGLASTVYLSLRSPEVHVPDVVGKDRFDAEHILGGAGLNYRVRATRPSNQLKADTVLFQVPRAGEVVKAGQTVAMDISRTAKEGEASEAVVDKPDENANTSESTAANDNKPKRNKNTNKNANENSNANGNRKANSNRPLNRNANTGNVNAGTNLNSNRPALIINNNANRGVNENRRAPVAKPSPAAKPTRENP
ncbi:MAG: PASTA domain-containing protein [Pyrinomonadaceae bacterium]